MLGSHNLSGAAWEVMQVRVRVRVRFKVRVRVRVGVRVRIRVRVGVTRALHHLLPGEVEVLRSGCCLAQHRRNWVRTVRRNRCQKASNDVVI